MHGNFLPVDQLWVYVNSKGFEDKIFLSRQLVDSDMKDCAPRSEFCRYTLLSNFSWMLHTFIHICTHNKWSGVRTYIDVSWDLVIEVPTHGILELEAV